MRALAVIVPVAAAIDSVVVRLVFDHRPTEGRLFLEALALWAGLGLVAWMPAWLSRRVAVRLVGRRAWPMGLWLGLWTLLPVAAHQLLDRYTGLGRDVSGLLTARPWLELAGLLGAAGVASFLVGRSWELLARVRPLAAIAAVALVCGWFLPVEPAPRLPSRTVAEGPDVLLMVWDTARAPSLSAYGAEAPTTPALESWADSALRFEDARSASVFTFTSHLSMLTGLYPSEHGARLIDQWFDPLETRPLALRFHEAGYRTGAFVGTGVLAARTGIGVGFEVFDDQVDPLVCDTAAWALVHDVQSVLAPLSNVFRNNGLPHWIQDFQRPADEVLARAEAWLRRPDERPFFCLVNLYDVHWPYLPSGDARERHVAPYEGPMTGYSWRGEEVYRKGYEATDADARHVEDLYEGEVWDLDAQVARFLESVDEELADAVVLVTSDHGEAFGVGGVWEHDDVYEPQVHVPFLLRLPGPEAPSGAVGGYVSGIDVAPTLLGAAGLSTEGLGGLDLTRERPPADRVVRVEDRDHLDPTEVRVALYRDRFKLVRRGHGEETSLTLHDLESDPEGLHDVSGQYPEVAAELWTVLQRVAAERRRDPNRRASVNLDALEGLGYLGD